MNDPILYDYWRSSASYRVRIALNLAEIIYVSVPVDLLKRDHKSPEHLERNPQGLVPALEIDGHLLTQSLAIINYISETRTVKLLPENAFDRARSLAIAHAIAMDIHPVCNLGVVTHVMDITEGGDDVRTAWMKKFIGEGLAAVELMLHQTLGPFCVGNTITIADVCLMPQVYNAMRWGIDMTTFKRINSIAELLKEIPAFIAAHPDQVKP
jgi:maleylacetoacetate isomerase